MKKLTKEQVLQIGEKRNAGKTNAEIALELGVSSMTISYWVKRLRDSGQEVKRFARGGNKAMEL